MHESIYEYGHVVFDWNGTIVDDARLALDCVNRLRLECGLPLIDSETYRRLFRFPIFEFYQDIGFDFTSTPFPKLVSRYLEYFDLAVADCEICQGFHELAVALKARDIAISVLSASHQATLDRVAAGKQIAVLVDNLFGLSNEHAESKLERARELDRHIARSSRGSVLMIGDTDHDHHVASDLGWDFIAVASGHQARLRLEKLGVPVFDTLDELILGSRIPSGGLAA